MQNVSLLHYNDRKRKASTRQVRDGLPASDLDTCVRLSKTPKKYTAVRQRHQEPQYKALLSADRTSWEPGELVRFKRSRSGSFVWLPNEEEETSAVLDSEDEVEAQGTTPYRILCNAELQKSLEARTGVVLTHSRFTPLHKTRYGVQGTPLPHTVASTRREAMDDKRDYDTEYYLQQLLSYIERLRKAFAPEDYAQIFRLAGQAGLFDRPIETIQPRWIRYTQDLP